MLTVRDIAAMPGLGLAVVGGSDGLDNPVSWLHVSELEDPTEFLEGGEFLLTTGLGVGELASTQRSYVRRLAEHRLAGLGFGLGLGFAETPPALLAEADKLGFPVVSVLYEVPFVAITKAAVSYLANEQLEQLERARGSRTPGGRRARRARVEALLAIVCNHLDCSLALVDEGGRVVGERHAQRRVGFDRAVELLVVGHEEKATLRAARSNGEFGEYDRLVLHHGQTALAFELSRRRAVSAAELRLAGDLLDDLEDERLDDRETARRMAAFGLEADREYARCSRSRATRRRATASARTWRRSSTQTASVISRRHTRRAAFLVEGGSEEEILALARRVVAAHPHARRSRAPGPAARHSAAACSRRAPRSTRVPATWRPT